MVSVTNARIACSAFYRVRAIHYNPDIIKSPGRCNSRLELLTTRVPILTPSSARDVPTAVPDRLSSFSVTLFPCGGSAHLADLRALEARHLALPHDYARWPLY